MYQYQGKWIRLQRQPALSAKCYPAYYCNWGRRLGYVDSQDVALNNFHCTVPSTTTIRVKKQKIGWTPRRGGGEVPIATARSDAAARHCITISIWSAMVDSSQINIYASWHLMPLSSSYHLALSSLSFLHRPALTRSFSCSKSERIVVSRWPFNVWMFVLHHAQDSEKHRVDHRIQFCCAFYSFTVNTLYTRKLYTKIPKGDRNICGAT